MTAGKGDIPADIDASKSDQAGTQTAATPDAPTMRTSIFSTETPETPPSK